MSEGIARAAMFAFGIVMAIVGAAVPALSERLAFTLADVGRLFLVMNVAMLAASLVVGLVVDRFGFRLPLAAGAWSVAAGVGLMASAGTYGLLLPAVACLGLGGGALNGSANTLVADLHDEPRRKASALNRLGVFFGFGALVLPFSLGALTSTFGFAGLLQATAAACVALGLAATLARLPAPKQQQGWPLAHVPAVVREPVVLALAALLFFQSGNEFVLGGFTATYLTRELGATAATASYGLAAFWAAIMGVRVVLGQVLTRVSPSAVVTACAVLSAGAALFTAWAPTLAAGIAGIVLTGLALGGIFPTVLSVAGARFPERSGTVFGVLFAVALTGGIVMPWIAGHLADAAGLRWILALAAANFAAVAALSRVPRTGARHC